MVAVGVDAVGAFFFLNSLLDIVANTPIYAPVTASATAWNMIVMAFSAL